MKLHKPASFIIRVIFIFGGSCQPVFTLKAQENAATGFLRQARTMAEQWELNSEKL